MTELVNYLDAIKSKNSGPFRLTVDLFFKSAADYEEVAATGIINERTIMDVYGIEEEDITGIYEIAELNVIKFSIVRPIPSGDFHDSDLDGSQQNTGMLSVQVPE